MEKQAMKRVAVPGTGAIGSPMARCLIRMGFSTTGHDVRREATEPLVAVGAKRAEKVAD